jgi:hypothetical protein
VNTEDGGERKAHPPGGIGAVGRRAALKVGGAAALGTALASLDLVGRVAAAPNRLAHAAKPLPDIQHDFGNFIAPAETIDGVPFRFGPVHTVFVTATLNREPTRKDATALSKALTQIESAYEFSPSGLFTIVGYGRPYFLRLPSALVAKHVPATAHDPKRSVLEEAVPGPTDVHPAHEDVTKANFEVRVKIEANDLLFTFRSDHPANLSDVLQWLFHSSNSLRGRKVASPPLGDLLKVTTSRAMFVSRGLPRQLADREELPYASMIHPQSPMWMGFADQQVDGAGPAEITTFAGNRSARLTTARKGDYLDNGSIQHLSHVILDLQQYYDVDDGEPGEDADYLSRVQYMYRSNPPPARGYSDQYTDGGGPAFLRNEFRGKDDADLNAKGEGTIGQEHRIGHLSALHRVSRADDGTALHIRMDGPGYDALDVPGGAKTPKLQFTIFLPTAELFARMRAAQASTDLQSKYKVDDHDNGLERFITATRRQNFLVPPRRHRSFPLLELT